MKAVKHVWSVLCRHSIIDNESNNISLQEVLEKLHMDIGIKAKNPQPTLDKITVPFRFEIVTLWSREDYKDKEERKVDVKIEIFDPHGKRIGEMVNSFVLTPNFKRMRGRARSENMSLTVSGKYVFRVSGKEKGDKDFDKVAELPLEVEIARKRITEKAVN